MDKLVEILESIRLKNGWRVQTIAEKLSVSYVTYWRWVNGERNPSAMARSQIEAFLKSNKES